jgi:hypothetical protein
MFWDEGCRENQNTHFVFSITPPPPENRAVYELMWKICLGQTGHGWQYNMAHETARWTPNATNTLRISNKYCFSTATMVALKRLNATLKRTLPVFLRVHTYIGLHTYIHTYVRTHVHNKYIHTHTYIHYIHTYVCTYARTYIHTHTYIHTLHTYIHTYVCTYART